VVVLALTLAVVALFGTRAVADEGEGDGAFFGSGQASSTQSESEQAQPEQSQSEQPQGEQQQADMVLTINSSGDDVVAGGTPQEPDRLAAERLQPAAVDAQTQLQATGDQADVRQPPDQAGEEEQGDPGGCAGEGCSKLPLLAVEVPGGGPGDDGPRDHDMGSDPRWHDATELLYDVGMLIAIMNDIEEAISDFVLDGDFDRLADTVESIREYGPTAPDEILGELALLSARQQALERQAADHPGVLAALQHVRELIQEARQQLRDLDLPATAVNLDTRTPGYDQVKPELVPKQPGTSAADLKTSVPAIKATTGLKTTVPPSRATDVPPTSDLRKRTWTEAAAAALGVDPSTVHDASVATSALLLGTAGLAWLASHASPQLRLGLLQGMTRGLPKGGLNAVPFMTPDRRVDS